MPTENDRLSPIEFNLRYKYRDMGIDIQNWLTSNIGPEGVRYTATPNMITMQESDENIFLPTRCFSVIFNYEEDALAFKLRWL